MRNILCVDPIHSLCIHLLFLVQLGIWQNLLVFILHHEAFLILNDEHKTHEKLTHALKEQNLDQSMYIGHMHEFHHKAYDETPLGTFKSLSYTRFI